MNVTTPLQLRGWKERQLNCENVYQVVVTFIYLIPQTSTLVDLHLKMYHLPTTI